MADESSQRPVFDGAKSVIVGAVLLDGKLHVYKRPNSKFWQCSTYIGSKNRRQTTKETNLVVAQEFAREWYLLQYAMERQRRRAAMPLDGTVQLPLVGTDQPVADRPRRTPSKPSGPTFGQAAEAFLAEYEVITQGERNAVYVKNKGQHVRNHLIPFFGADRPVNEVKSDLVQAYRVHRKSTGIDLRTKKQQAPSRSTLHSEEVTLRQILKTAIRKGWIDALPDMSKTYRRSGKVDHRAWFSPDEYKMLYEATRELAKNPPKERWRPAAEDLHDFVLFVGNTGMRPGEAFLLQERDVTIVKDAATGERILEIEVRGKRGVGYCKSMPGAVHPFQRIRQRKGLAPTDLVFGRIHVALFNRLLDKLNLKHDRDGRVRTTHSLRHTYICMRLMEGADIYQIAKNCRTSVEMIEKHYAAHLKNTIDASAINVRKPKPSKIAARKPGEKKKR